MSSEAKNERGGHVDVDVRPEVAEELVAKRFLSGDERSDFLSGLEPFVQETVTEILRHTLPLPVDVSVSLVTDAEIRKLNAEWRDLDRATDVLSFPQLGPEEVEALRERPPDSEQGPPILLGDVVISPATVWRRSDEDAPFWRELGRVLVHGVLHLQGWTHERKKRRQEMREKEAALLASLEARIDAHQAKTTEKRER